MDRADKIFTALCLLGLVAVLCWKSAIPVELAEHVNSSATPDEPDIGPAYLLSNNPRRRHGGDHAPDTSYGGPFFY